MTRYIAILGTLDTKGAEVDFLRQVVRAEGGEPLVIDTGVLDEPTAEADVTRHQVAEAAGSSIEELIQKGDKSRALVVMAVGCQPHFAAVVAQGTVQWGAFYRRLTRYSPEYTGHAIFASGHAKTDGFHNGQRSKLLWPLCWH